MRELRAASNIARRPYAFYVVGEPFVYFDNPMFSRRHSNRLEADVIRIRESAGRDEYVCSAKLSRAILSKPQDQFTIIRTDVLDCLSAVETRWMIGGGAIGLEMAQFYRPRGVDEL